MKHLPKSTPTEILNDPYGFTYKEMSEVIGEDKARALYTELYKQPFHKKNLSISTKKVYKSSDTEKYVYELKDNKYRTVIEPVSDTISNVVTTLKNYTETITFVGDGSEVHKDLLSNEFSNCIFASAEQNVQTSISIGKSAFDKYVDANYKPVYSLSPIYLKKSQAEINLENSKK